MNVNSGELVDVVCRWPFKRIVILTGNGACWLGAACAIALANSPFLSRGELGDIRSIAFADRFDSPQAFLSAQECVSCGVKLNPSLAAFNSLCCDVTAGAALMMRVACAVDAKDMTTDAPRFAPDPENDLYVYISAWSDADCHNYLPLDSLRAIQGSGHLVLLTDYATHPSAWNVAQQLSGWKVLSCCVSCYGPPCHDIQLAGSLVRRCDEIRGVLESVCLGVALGTVKQLPFRFRDPVRVTPLDVAANTLLVFASLQRDGHALLSSAEGAFIDMGAIGDADDDNVLVWGMFAEYLMDYYGRFGPTIAKSLPLPRVFDPTPSLHLSASVADLVNYGVSLMSPFRCCYAHAAAKRRKQLVKHLHESVKSSQMNAVLEGIDAALLRINDKWSFPTSSQCDSEGATGSVCSSASFRTGGCYKAVMQMLAHNSSLRSVHTVISLNNVNWDLYVKALAQAVVERIASQFFGHHVSPPPVFPHYHNDIVFRGIRRAPATNLFPRRLSVDLHWTLRCGMKSNGVRAVALPGLTKESQGRIMAHPNVLRAIEGAAKSENSSKDVVEARAVSILRTVGDTLNQVQLRVFGLIVRRVLFHLYDEVSLNDGAFERLHRAINTPRSQTVLIPAHRSYVDFLIMTYLLVVMSLPPPHICAGEDFLRMGPISTLMRGSGAFFMRRSFRNDRLYHVLFKEYVSQLVLQGQVMQFFIEGTRSRTGKTQHPRLGILKFITDAFFGVQDSVDDVYIVPISLSYDELLEAKLYADEQFGVSKPKENVCNLVRARSLLNVRHGSIHVNVGEAISLRRFRDNPHQSPEPFLEVKKGNGVSQPNTNSHVTPPEVLTNLAWHVTHYIQENTVITPTALLASILSAFAPTEAGMRLQEIHSHMLWLRTHVSLRKGPLSLDCTGSDAEGLTCKALSHLSSFVEVGSEKEVVVYIRQDVSSSAGIGICSNQLVHLFVDEAVVAAVAQVRGEFNAQTKTLCVQKSSLEEGCELLRGLLSTEFQDYLPSCPYTLASWLESVISRLHSHTADGDNDDGPEAIILPSPVATPIKDVEEKKKEEEEEEEGCEGGEEKMKSDDKDKEKCETHSMSHGTVVLRPTRLFRFLSGILSPFLESIYLASLAVCAIVGSGSETVLRRKPLLKVCQRHGLDMYAKRHLILHSQSCGSNSLQNAMNGVAAYCGLESRFSANDPTYTLPSSTASSLLSTRAQTTLRCAGSLVSSAIDVPQSEEEMQKAKDTIARMYLELLAAEGRVSKI